MKADMCVYQGPNCASSQKEEARGEPAPTRLVIHSSMTLIKDNYSVYEDINHEYICPDINV